MRGKCLRISSSRTRKGWTLLHDDNNFARDVNYSANGNCSNHDDALYRISWGLLPPLAAPSRQACNLPQQPSSVLSVRPIVKLKFAFHTVRSSNTGHFVRLSSVRMPSNLRSSTTLSGIVDLAGYVSTHLVYHIYISMFLQQQLCYWGVITVWSCHQSSPAVLNKHQAQRKIGYHLRPLLAEHKISKYPTLSARFTSAPWSSMNVTTDACPS